ncbi:MAG: PAS domain S-box protein [Burkholderiales bacterium]
MKIRELLPTLRSRLLALVLAAFVPVIALAVLAAGQQWRYLVEESQQELDRLAQLAAANQQRVIEGTRQIVQMLSRSPQLLDPDPERCAAFLRPLIGVDDWYANFGVIGADGYLRCHALGEVGVYLGDRRYFKEALASGELAAGEFQIGRATERLTINLAIALNAPDGKAQAVVYAALDLNLIADIARTTELPQGVSLTVFDRQGVVLARHPDQEAWLGKPVHDGRIVRAAQAESAGHLELRTNTERVHVAHAAVGGLPEPAMFVAVEQGHRSMVAGAVPILSIFILALVVVMLLALAITWFAGTALVVRPVRSIVDAAGRIGEGDLSARTGLSRGDGELGQLGAAFDDMTRVLADRLTDLEQTQARLEASERAYRQLFAENPLPMWIFDHETLGFLEVNAAALEKYGYTREEFLAMNMRDIRPAEELARMEHFVRAAPTGPYEAGIWKHRRKNGSVVLAETRTHDTLWQGRAARLVLAYDVTEREEALAALEQLQVRYRTLVELSPEPVHIHRDGRLVFLNMAAVRFFGADSPEQLIGRSVFDFILPEYRAQVEERLAAIAQGEMQPRVDQQLRTLSGDVKEVEVSATRIMDEGRPAIMVVLRDMTGRNRAQRALEESERRFRQMVETAGEGIWIMDPSERLQFVNPRLAQMLDRREEDLLGRHAHDFVAAEDLELARARLVDRRAGVASRYELRLLRGDGTPVWTLASGSPIFGPNGDYQGTLAMFTDIGALKRAQGELEKINLELEERVRERTAQLEASNDELRAFAYSVSHDLRAPLRTIEGFSQALLEDFRDRLDGQGQDYLNRVCAAAQRMGNLIDDLLALSRVARQEMQRQSVDLSALATGILAELADAHPDRNVETAIQSGLSVEGDPGLLRILLQNLLDNAWKFTQKQKQATIRFDVSEAGGEWIYCVRDNGAGFDMTYSGKLFGVFQRLHPEREFAGSGVGLATAQRIVRRHGGRIWAESEVGKGASFYFTLGAPGA